MGNSRVVKAVVNPTANVDNNTTPMQLALFNADGTRAATVKKQAAQVDSTASTVAAVVTDLNALLAKLRLAGVIS